MEGTQGSLCRGFLVAVVGPLPATPLWGPQPVPGTACASASAAEAAGSLPLGPGLA